MNDILNREQEKMEKLQQAREMKVKLIARELLENERNTSADREAIFRAQQELRAEELTLERQLNTMTNSNMKVLFR